MNADFDIAATSYDDTFTNSSIGRLQRDRVWTYLEDHLPKDKSLKILELNCGTGEDAIFFGSNGHEVIATDISTEMVSCSRQKIAAAHLAKRVEVMQLDINRLAGKSFPYRFDLVFSNFGGLNCLAKKDLEKLSAALKKHLKPNSRFISVVMPSFCLMESCYFLAKREWRKIFRRKTSTAVSVNVEGKNVNTWYYSPRAFEQIFNDKFTTINIKPIGFLPSYFEQIQNDYPSLISLDKALHRLGLSSSSDHYLIDLQVR